jgi:hypothetical protein
MRIWRFIVLVGLAVLGAVTCAEAAAVVLRTAAFPAQVVSGDASCAVTNIGPVSGKVSMVLYDYFRAVVSSSGLATLAPNATAITGAVSLTQEVPAHCECTVPIAANYRCALHWVDGTNVIVIPAP